MAEQKHGTPWEGGRLAASIAQPMASNPYPVGSDEHDEWSEGYDSVVTTDEDGELKDDA